MARATVGRLECPHVRRSGPTLGHVLSADGALCVARMCLDCGERLLRPVQLSQTCACVACCTKRSGDICPRHCDCVGCEFRAARRRHWANELGGYARRA